MKLATKSTLVLAMVVVMLTVANYLIVNQIVMPSYASLERDEAIQDLRRFANAVESEIGHLRSFVQDWAMWDDTYQFVSAPDDDYVNANLILETFDHNKINLIFYYDGEGRPVWGKAVDLEGLTAIGIAEFPADAEPLIAGLVGLKRKEDVVSGVVATSQGPMILAAWPILTSEGEGPSRGTLIMGRFLNGTVVGALAKQVHVATTALGLEEARQSGFLVSVLAELANADRPVTREADETSLEAFGVLRDIFAKPAVLIKTESPRAITAIGTRTVHYLTIALVIVGLVITGVMWLLMRRMIIHPVTALTEHALHVRSTGDLTERLTLGGDDELSTLSREFDRTLAHLADAQIRLTEAMEQAEAAARSKSKFLATMSHELRPPLNAIIGFSEVLRSEMFGPIGGTKNSDYIHHIHQSGLHLLDLINDILDLSKIESGAGVLHEEIVDLNVLVAEIKPLVEGGGRKAGIDLNFHLADAMAKLWVDRRILKQIILNLLSNATKFTPKGGTVTLAIWLDEENRPIFEVKDTGIGIAREDIPRALAPFQQVDSTLSRKHQGTGLGLPLASKFVELHGGTLELESEVGRGTVVTVSMPSERVLAAEQDRAIAI